MASLLSSTELPQRGTTTGRASLSINRLRTSEDFFHEENPSAEFDFDFFELVPKSVYAGVEQEDIW